MSGFAVPALGAAIIGSSIMSAIGSIGQGRAQQRAGEFNAEMAERQAEIQRQQAEIQRQQATSERDVAAGRERDYRRDQSALMARRRALLGATGIEAGTGSPLLATGDFAREVELQALRIRAGGETTATRIGQQAALTEAQAGLTGSAADLYRSAGRSAQQGGFLRAGSSLLQGFGAAFGG